MRNSLSSRVNASARDSPGAVDMDSKMWVVMGMVHLSWALRLELEVGITTGQALQGFIVGAVVPLTIAIVWDLDSGPMNIKAVGAQGRFKTGGSLTVSHGKHSFHGVPH